MPRPINDRIAVLERRIRYLEKYPRSSNSAAEIIKAKEELQGLLKEQAKRDRLRSIPLLSSKITGYRFYCHDCWDKTYQIAQEERKKSNSGLITGKNE